MRRKQTNQKKVSILYYPNPALSRTAEIKLTDMYVLDCLLKYPISKVIVDFHVKLKIIYK